MTIIQAMGGDATEGFMRMLGISLLNIRASAAPEQKQALNLDMSYWPPRHPTPKPTSHKAATRRNRRKRRR